MNTKYYEKLEYYKILELISDHTITYLGKNLVLKMLPIFNKEAVESLLNETLEATTLIYRKGNLPLIPIANTDFSVKAIESRFFYWNKWFIGIKFNIKIIKRIKRVLCKRTKLS